MKFLVFVSAFLHLVSSVKDHLCSPEPSSTEGKCDGVSGSTVAVPDQFIVKFGGFYRSEARSRYSKCFFFMAHITPLCKQNSLVTTYSKYTQKSFIYLLCHFIRYIAAAVAKSYCNATGLPKILPRNNLMALKYPSDFELIEVPSLSASEVPGCGSPSLTAAIARHPLIKSVTPQHKFKGSTRGLLQKVWSMTSISSVSPPIEATPACVLVPLFRGQ